jgi:hypothetical protein
MPRMRDVFEADVREAEGRRRTAGEAAWAPLRNNAALPPVVRRYLDRALPQWSQKATPLPGSAKLEWEDFALLASGRWTGLQAEQTDFALPGPARYVYATGRAYGGLLSLETCDRFDGAGGGRVTAKIAGLLNVADAHGPEIDSSGLATVLAELPALPTLALLPELSWEELPDAHAARATFVRRAPVGGGTLQSVSGVFHFDAEGDIDSYDTNDRYMIVRGGTLVHRPWRATMAGYVTDAAQGVRYPTRLAAAWLQNAAGESAAGPPVEYFRGRLARITYA